jgi:hypothetical protein
MTERLTLVAIAAASLLACSGADMMRRFTPADADARSRAYLEQLKRGEIDSAAARLVPQLATPDARVELARIDSILGDADFDSSAIIGANINTFNGVRHTNLTYEFHSRAGWLLANVATVDTAGSWLVEGVSARPLAKTLEEASRFTLTGKTWRHYLWLALAIVSLVLSLGAAVFLATRRGMPNRGWWALVSLVGVGSFSLDWTSGATGFRLVNVQLLGAGFVRLGPAAPWIITFAIPAGAFLALARYRRWHTTARVVTVNEDHTAEGA